MLILNFITRWNRVVGFTLRPLYSLAETPLLVGPQNRSGCFEEEAVSSSVVST